MEQGAHSCMRAELICALENIIKLCQHLVLHSIEFTSDYANVVSFFNEEITDRKTPFFCFGCSTTTGISTGLAGFTSCVISISSPSSPSSSDAFPALCAGPIPLPARLEQALCGGDAGSSNRVCVLGILDPRGGEDGRLARLSLAANAEAYSDLDSISRRLQATRPKFRPSIGSVIGWCSRRLFPACPVLYERGRCCDS